MLANSRSRSGDGWLRFVTMLVVVYATVFMMTAFSGDPTLPGSESNEPPPWARTAEPQQQLPVRSDLREQADQPRVVPTQHRNQAGPRTSSVPAPVPPARRGGTQQPGQLGAQDPTGQQQQGQQQQMRFQVEDAREFVPQEHEANRRSMPDSEEADPWKRRQQDTWRLIILFQHNFPILKQAVEGFERASDIMVPNMIIVDNSKTKEASKSIWLVERVAEVIETPEQLNFPQLHNFMASIALRKRLEFYFWAHADNYVLPLNPARDMGKDAIDCLREQIAKSPDWGMTLFAYDHLAAYRTQALVQVPWDPHVFQYGSECDAYGRIRDAGYSSRACKIHHSYDMKRVIGIRDSDPYELVKEKLDREAEDKAGRNQWREGSMSEAEQAWRQEMKKLSREYLAAKWGEVKCKLRGVPCSKPWPYCPTCPDDLTGCYNKHPTWEELDAIHTRVHDVFANDPNPPPLLKA